MGRRGPVLAGLINVIGARRLKQGLFEDLALNNHAQDDGATDTIDSSTHPACGGRDVKECPCKEFYEDLKRICEEKHHGDCADIVYKLWNNQDVDDELVYNIYLAPTEDNGKPSIPVFWSGFSWTIGTRHTMDKMLEEASDGPSVFRDIEHADAPIGQLLRKRNWDRHCHASAHDSNLWIALSKKYAYVTRQAAEKRHDQARAMQDRAEVAEGAVANGAPLGALAAGEFAVSATGIVAGGASLVGGVVIGLVGAAYLGERVYREYLKNRISVVLIAINYHVDKLDDSFLVKHELENLYPFHSIIVWDFKNHCSSSLLHLIASHTSKEGYDNKPFISCLSAHEVAFRHGRGQFSSIGEYKHMVKKLDYANRIRQTRVNKMMDKASTRVNKMMNFLEKATSFISDLESCQTYGIVWRSRTETAPAQPMNTSLGYIEECRRRCRETRHCVHFNLFTADGTCQLLSREGKLYYESAGNDVISGRPNCSVDEQLAAEAKKILALTQKKMEKDLKAARLIDVTNLIRTDAFENSGYHCCCDKRKMGDAGNKDDHRGINNETRANYCAIAELWKWGKCGGVKIRYDTQRAHNYLYTGGTCEITQKNVPDLVKFLAKADYCPRNVYEFMDMQVDIPAAAIGETRNASCIDGSVGIVECKVGTPEVGYWGPVRCGEEKTPVWCPATPKIDDAVPEIAAANIGEESLLRCDQGEPLAEKTRCSEMGWVPFAGVDEASVPPVCFEV